MEGKVTVDGGPASSGNVVFTTTEGKSVSGMIEPDGNYRAIDVPVGAVQIAVQPVETVAAPPDAP
ncbi:MAG TPA: hypothetical protein VMG10_14425, partial [Gemmataceae bacterium]|nr:hypothetical protein [Gemmataceae bacterium]